jgi:hypothetical protein
MTLTRTLPAGPDVLALRRELAAARAEIVALRAQLDGNVPAATRWLQAKVDSQRGALRTLNGRVLNQRFVLRALSELGRGLTRDEYLSARGQVRNDQVLGQLAPDVTEYAAS